MSSSIKFGEENEGSGIPYYGSGSILRTLGTERRAMHGYGNGTRNINVGGKKYTVRRSDMLADPRSKLADWFRPGAVRLISTDRAGNVFIDSDSKTFRHILAYLRFKKERFVGSLALPSLPDELAKLVGECEALNLAELKEIALEMLNKYLRMEEQHYMASYVQMTLRDLEAWQFEKEQQSSISESKSPIPQQERQQILNNKSEKKAVREHSYDEWDNI
uniref:Potassium channel tetramerisation-type BTB domain-containing protein n=1 Tax=Meloidogyne incognita TaxID=6306 RepID=A0A914KXQ5_MELIC